ncbi:sec-independent protein translocase protein TatB [Sodalis ligni]|uniref:Sec-independent protein translocase protein TatB n=1 Tax=Sodalis ligni TaxID=2697027 RepID=A0A4R1NE58_9GAMM|nr:sec-independent protein translocase protein TatB [Sodalis ligni]
MFDIGFGELALIFVIGLVVLGPERLPVAVRTVVGWIKALRSMAATVQNELSQELKLQELQDSLKKVEEASKNNLSPELKASMEELREAADSMKKTFQSKLVPDEENPPHTIHNPVVTDSAATHSGVTPAEGASQAQAPAMAPGADAPSPDEMARRAEETLPVPPGIADSVTPDTTVRQRETPTAVPQGIADNVTPAKAARLAQAPAAVPSTPGESGNDGKNSAVAEPSQHQAPPIPTSHNDR